MNRSKLSRAVTLALRCYPKRWQARHGEEAAELAHLLAAEGMPAASVAWSYLGGAARERLAPLASRPRVIALLATASLAAVSVPVWASPAPAGATSAVRVLITDRAAAAEQLRSVFSSHDFEITVRQEPVPARQAGSIVAAWTTGPPGSSNRTLREIEGTCAYGSSGCTVGLMIPSNFAGTATVLIGTPSPTTSSARAARNGS